MQRPAFDRCRSLALGAAMAAAALLTGCVAYPVYRTPAYPVFGEEVAPGETVYEAPPPPQTEVIGVAPAPGWIWLGGYWGWSAGRHVWVGGRWSAPRPGYYWVPHRWAPVGRGWQAYPGHWAR